MKVRVLASGSKGNVTYIETENHKILFDLGMNVKYIKDRLAEINVNIKDIDYVFFSHEHKDHISALPVFIKYYKATICMSSIMFKYLPNVHDYDHILIYEDEVLLSDVKIEMIQTSHDAHDSRAFIVTTKDSSIVYLTDTGYLNQKLYRKLCNKEIYLFESNHDVEMLMNGNYPEYIKHRIFSPKGHLCNNDASYHLAKLIGPNTKKIVLMHLSENNNTEELALKTIKTVFKNQNVNFRNISCAKQRESVTVK